MVLQTLCSFFKDTPGSTSFQEISDLHLEVNQQYSSFGSTCFTKVSHLGRRHWTLQDYSAYFDFLQKRTTKFEVVFLVLGNHEFYNGSLESGLTKARQLEQEPSLNRRLVLLYQGRYDVP
jgi:hypothetical protein